MTFYRNRPLFAVSVAMTVLMVAVAVYFLFIDAGVARDPWDVVLALALPGLVAWVVLRVGLIPSVEWGEGRLTVHNPFLTCTAPLSDVRLLGRADKGGAFEIRGIGPVTPFAMSRSVFDGRRANTARRALRDAVRQTPPPTEEPPATARRTPRIGWYDLLLLPFALSSVWAFLP
ncbi:hypothetical protein ACIQNU_20650 [Streptomyces sp. NPDC091292]|uniref:hypothetical protein n=1 Tax=Streptomyces sp. NPDC091292 TaxID=3365991 RepID=UPI00381BAE5B